MKPVVKVAVALVAALGIGVGTAYAGYVDTQTVRIYRIDELRFATGVLTRTRESADTREYIRCQTSSNSYSSCVARSASGDVLSCMTYDARMAEEIRSISPDSRVVFWVTGVSSCESIHVTHGSDYL